MLLGLLISFNGAILFAIGICLMAISRKETAKAKPIPWREEGRQGRPIDVWRYERADRWRLEQIKARAGL